MKKVLFIAYHYPPIGWSGTQRSLKFTKYLPEFNWEPIVVTVKDTSLYMNDDSLKEDIPENLKVVRMEEINQQDYLADIVNKMSEKFSPVLDMLSEGYKKHFTDSFKNYVMRSKSLLQVPDMQTFWAVNVLENIEKQVDFNDIDLIYSTCGPFSCHLIARKLKHKYNIPWVADFRDEWTNNPYQTFDRNNIIVRIQEDLEKCVLGESDKIITISDIAKNNYINKFGIDDSKIQVITNGYDEDDFKGLNNLSDDKEKFTIVYSGSLYMERMPYTVLQAMNELIDEGLIDKDKVWIKFIGTCDQNIYNNIFKYNKHNIIKYLGYLKHDQSLSYVVNANLLLLLVGVNPKVKSVYTGKIFEYLRSANPILSISPKESLVEKLLDETSCGKNVQYSDVEGIKKFIYEQYKHWENGTEAIMPNENEIYKYDREYLTEQLGKIFDKLLELKVDS
ncbi:glycosyltransferase [Clostridium oceanicum]|uniref:Glycosyltransferase family 4 protein n=1 Tax=Clostridium oceanicum TaxID=1543 RepID=A0ABN1JAK3_9CLOT